MARVASCGDRGSAAVTKDWMARLLRLVLLGALIAVVVVTTATADRPACTHGVSSVGPVTLSRAANGRIGQILYGETKPHTEACLP